jgi:ABC-type proline/glycine betaine transport system permease subunit
MSHSGSCHLVAEIDPRLLTFPTVALLAWFIGIVGLGAVRLQFRRWCC